MCVLSCRSPCERRSAMSACRPVSLSGAMGGSYVGRGGVPARRGIGVPVSVTVDPRSLSLSLFLCLLVEPGGRMREGPGVGIIFLGGCFFFFVLRFGCLGWGCGGCVVVWL
ncbi:hypothetical protein BJX76DRAFT_324964 [Aspergillus varians]